jgi:hypothetical protein
MIEYLAIRLLSYYSRHAPLCVVCGQKMSIMPAHSLFVGKFAYFCFADKITYIPFRRLSLPKYGLKKGVKPDVE